MIWWVVSQYQDSYGVGIIENGTTRVVATGLSFEKAIELVKKHNSEVKQPIKEWAVVLAPGFSDQQ